MSKLEQKKIDEMILSHKWLVVKTAARYKSFGISMDDLISEGTIGLIKAAQKFDTTKNCSLSTYATFWIKAYIMQHIIDNWSIVKFATTKNNRNMFFKDSSCFGKDSSLNNQNENGQEFIELVPSNDNIENEFIVLETRNILGDAINTILDKSDERTKDIFINRRMLNKPQTLDILAKKHNLSKERVRQIENATVKDIGYEFKQYIS